MAKKKKKKEWTQMHKGRGGQTVFWTNTGPSSAGRKV